MRFSIYGCSRLALALAVFPAAARAQTPAPDVSRPTDTLVPPPANLKEISGASRDETEGNITFLVPGLLQSLHYSRHPFDAEISSKFLDRYLDTLDHWHLFFLQSDLKEFDVYRTTLPELSMRQHDFTPATVIFSRFLQRAAERTAYATNLLRTETFQFTNEERFIPNRHTLPNPANLEEAHQLWREELRYEYLDEKLKEADMAISGPASFDAQSNVVIMLPLEYTNSLSANRPGRRRTRQRDRTVGHRFSLENSWIRSAMFSAPSRPPRRTSSCGWRFRPRKLCGRSRTIFTRRMGNVLAASGSSTPWRRRA